MWEICPAAFMERAFVESTLPICGTWMLNEVLKQAGKKAEGAGEEVRDLGIMTPLTPARLHNIKYGDKRRWWAGTNAQ